MATEVTADAAIVLPAEQAGNITVSYVEGGPGSIVNLTTASSDATVALTGPVTLTGERASGFQFTFAQAAELTVENTLSKSTIIAAEGNDSVGFVAGSNQKNTVVKLADGADSVNYGGAIKGGAKVRMGADSSADVVEVGSLKDIKTTKGLVVREFGTEDTLIVNGKTYTTDNVGKADFKDKIIVKFD